MFFGIRHFRNYLGLYTGENNFENFHHINPRKTNKSHDLLYLHLLMNDYFENSKITECTKLKCDLKDKYDELFEKKEWMKPFQTNINYGNKEFPDSYNTTTKKIRTTKDVVVNQIILDLDEAIKVLPVSYATTDKGRATKGAALSLKARMLLYEGKWAAASQAAKEVMDLKAYALFPNYREMFRLQNENNSEVIFNVEFLAPRFTNNFDQSIYILNTPAPIKDLVDSYLMTDGKSIGNSSLYNPNQPYENRDPRLHQTIAVIGYKFNGKLTQLRDVVNTGFGLKKYTSFLDDVSTAVVPPNTELNPIVIRYAEILLTYAEAQNENVGPDASVYLALNAIRSRPSVKMVQVSPGLSKEEMRIVIRNERRIELAFEGLYYSDIRRWRTAEIVNNGAIFNYEGKPITNRTFNKNRDYLWPIPFTQIQENPQLIQNPGYN
jgi:hypothetical protein